MVCCKVSTLSRPMLSQILEGKREGKMGVRRERREGEGVRGARDGKEEEEEGQRKRKGEGIGMRRDKRRENKGEGGG